MDVPNYMESNSSGATIEMPIDVQLLIQTLIFVVIVFTGLITSVPVGMTSVSQLTVICFDSFQHLYWIYLL